MLHDKRIADRDVCEIEAEIVLPTSGKPVPCVVSDISEDGARLILSADVGVPSRFELLLPIAADIIDRRKVEMKWQRERTVGVRFERQ